MGMGELISSSGGSRGEEAEEGLSGPTLGEE